MRRTGLNRWRLGALAAAVAAAFTTALVSGASGAPAKRTPAKDSFKGRITAASGKFEGDHGSVVIYIHPRGSGSTRKLRLTIAGMPCDGASQCLSLNGNPRGTITTRSAGADAGDTFTIAASGAVTPMGQTSVSGKGRGTGFIARGRERMRLTLTSSDGQITIAAHSGEVRGFSSP